MKKNNNKNLMRCLLSSCPWRENNPGVENEMQCSIVSYMKWCLHLCYFLTLEEFEFVKVMVNTIKFKIKVNLNAPCDAVRAFIILSPLTA